MAIYQAGSLLDKSHISLGNADNESKATMFTDPTFTGTVNCNDLNADRTVRSYGKRRGRKDLDS